MEAIDGYLLLVADFPDRKIILPSVRSQPFFAKYRYESMTEIFGIARRKSEASGRFNRQRVNEIG